MSGPERNEPTDGSSQRSTDDIFAGAPGPATGLFRSLRGLIATLVALAQTRLELLTTELQGEVQRAAALAMWGFVALVAAMIGLVMGGLTIVFAYWETHRVLASLLVTGTFLSIAVIAGIVIAAKINSRERVLDATLTELAKDREALKERMTQD